jgi:hypothetical protein
MATCGAFEVARESWRREWPPLPPLWGKVAEGRMGGRADPSGWRYKKARTFRGLRDPLP